MFQIVNALTKFHARYSYHFTKSAKQEKQCLFLQWFCIYFTFAYVASFFDEVDVFNVRRNKGVIMIVEYINSDTICTFCGAVV